MARYSLFVLKVPLNTNQPFTTNHLDFIVSWCSTEVISATVLGYLSALSVDLTLNTL